MRRVQIDSAGEALVGQGGVRGLVNRRATDQFRGILVEFRRPIVACRSLEIPIEQGRREVRREASDRDVLITPLHTLPRQTGQSGQRISNAFVRQLADVFG